MIKIRHKRGAFAMGGMAAFIPSKDTERNRRVLSKVTADKELEANNGHDGTGSPTGHGGYRHGGV